MRCVASEAVLWLKRPHPASVQASSKMIDGLNFIVNRAVNFDPLIRARVDGLPPKLYCSEPDQIAYRAADAVLGNAC